MADTMQFDLVSPERSLASLQATAVQIPGAHLWGICLHGDNDLRFQAFGFLQPFMSMPDRFDLGCRIVRQILRPLDGLRAVLGRQCQHLLIIR